MCLACQTISIVLYLAIFDLACGRQEGYQHGPKELTEEDNREIAIVRGSPVGKPDLMRELVKDTVPDDASLGNCEYWVTKIIDRDHIKNRKGLYPYHYRITCFADLGDDSLEYVWEVDNSDFGVVSFRWAFAPDFDP